jgi:AP-1 complex subunit gamma-1
MAAKFGSKDFDLVNSTHLQEIIDAFGSHVQVELQQRGVEYSQLFRRFDNMRAALLEPMPPLERDTRDGHFPNIET